MSLLKKDTNIFRKLGQSGKVRSAITGTSILIIVLSVLSDTDVIDSIPVIFFNYNILEFMDYAWASVKLKKVEDAVKALD